MLIKYLNNQLDQLYEQKVDLEMKISRNIKLQSEKEKLINALSSDDEDSYCSFSPYNFTEEDCIHISKVEKEITVLLDDHKKINEALIKNEIEIKYLKELLKEAVKKENYFKTCDSIRHEKQKFKLKVLDTVELERQRIARELHDSTVQNLTSMVHKAEFCSKLIDVDSIRCKLELQMMSKTIRKEIEDMREIIYNLRPMSFDDIGLCVTIQKEIERLRSRTDIKIEYVCNNYINISSSIVSLTILRMIQEACNNAIKYSEASCIKVEVNYNETEVFIKIEDNGKGFDINSIEIAGEKKMTGFGISMMQERVYLLSGSIHFNSEINKGTTIEVIIPISEEIEDEYKYYDN